MKAIATLAALSLLVVGQASVTKSRQNQHRTRELMNKNEHYTFKLSDKVTREKVTFKNRYGITLAGGSISS